MMQILKIVCIIELQTVLNLLLIEERRNIYEMSILR